MVVLIVLVLVMKVVVVLKVVVLVMKVGVLVMEVLRSVPSFFAMAVPTNKPTQKINIMFQSVKTIYQTLSLNSVSAYLFWPFYAFPFVFPQFLLPNTH